MRKQRKNHIPLTEEQYQNPKKSKIMGKVPQYYCNICDEGGCFYSTEKRTGETVFPYGSVIKAEKLEKDANHHHHMKVLSEWENEFWNIVP